MAEFLTTKGVAYNLENIIIEAKEKLVLVSPYLQISQPFYERLKDASQKGITIKIIFGKDELDYKEKNSLAELENVELFYFQNLHAKCYFNENTMVITSMNMYAFSESNNREMGVLISRSKDSELFEKAMQETLSIIQSSYSIELKTTKAKPKKGFCIRCNNQIKYNAESPYCQDCFSIWRQYQNYDYIENSCHRCGNNESTTMVKPQCYDCFNIWRIE